MQRLLILNGTCLDVLDDVYEGGVTYRESIRAHGVEPVAEERFRRLDSAQLAAVLQEAEGAIIPASAPLLPAALAESPRLAVLALAASGYEAVDLPAATRYGIAVTYAPVREGAEVVADLAFGLMLAVARQIPHHDRLTRAGDYQRGMGVSLWGKTLGIVGLGNIGRAVARRAAGFDLHLLASEPSPDHAFVEHYQIELVGLDELLRRSDFVSLHVRLNTDTRGLLGARELSLLRPSAYLINTARAALVDEDALTEALLHGRLAGAGLDDPPARRDSPLLSLPNVVFTPHLGNRAIEGVRAVTASALESAFAVLEGRQARYTLNPEVYASPQFRARLGRSSAI